SYGEPVFSLRALRAERAFFWMLALRVVCGRERVHGERARATCPTCGSTLHRPTRKPRKRSLRPAAKPSQTNHGCSFDERARAAGGATDVEGGRAASIGPELRRCPDGAALSRSRMSPGWSSRLLGRERQLPPRSRRAS